MPLTIGMIAAPVIGGLMGNDRANGAQNAANNARMQALAQYAGISIPELQDQMVNYEKYQSQGQLNPALEQVISQQNSGLQDVQVDPRLKASQMSALESIAGMASGNPQAGDLAGFELARRNVAGENQAKQNQILQDMQQRGQGGSGAELLAKLKGNQSSSDELAKMQLQQAQTMQQAKMQAIQEQANLASGIRTQDYGQAADAARAQDAINQYNAQNSQSVNRQNVGAQNSAQQFNLTNAQQLANNNVNVGNAQQDKNKGLIQQKFNNQLNLAAGKSGQYAANAAAEDKNATNQASMWSTVGQGVATGLGKFANNKKTSEE
jgi:hypothetical protein